MTVDTDLTMVEEQLAEAMRLTHIVTSGDNPHIDVLGDMDGREIVAIARTNGLEVVALCGFRWVPKFDPAKYDTCTMCLEEAHRRMEEENS